MKKVTKYLDHCLTEEKIENFNEEVLKYQTFALISQFVDYPNLDTITQTINKPDLRAGYNLYGMSEDGALVYLGGIIDSSG